MYININIICTKILLPSCRNSRKAIWGRPWNDYFSSKPAGNLADSFSMQTKILHENICGPTGPGQSQFLSLLLLCCCMISIYIRWQGSKRALAVLIKIQNFVFSQPAGNRSVVSKQNYHTSQLFRGGWEKDVAETIWMQILKEN